MDVISFPGSGDAAGRGSCPKHNAEVQEGWEEPCVPGKGCFMSPEGCFPTSSWKATFSIRFLSSARPSTGDSPSLQGPRPCGALLALRMLQADDGPILPGTVPPSHEWGEEQLWAVFQYRSVEKGSCRISS